MRFTKKKKKRGRGIIKKRGRGEEDADWSLSRYDYITVDGENVFAGLVTRIKLW